MNRDINKDKTIYVEFIDGTNVFVPIPSKYISENVYELLSTDEFDFEDKTILFEFGPGDIVEVKINKFESGESGFIANKLVKSGNKDNSFKRLLFYILNDSLTFEEALIEFGKTDLIKLIDFVVSEGFVYSTIKQFVEKYRDEIEALLNK